MYLYNRQLQSIIFFLSIVKTQKLRGHSRRHRCIERWRWNNLELRQEVLDKYRCDHVRILVRPWCDMLMTNRSISEPKRMTKKLILSGLLDIYEAWKHQLEMLGEPYYLKIWLFEPRFSRSQVVCAIGDRSEFYNNTFSTPERTKPFSPGTYGQLRKRLEAYHWVQRLDEDQYDNTWVGEEDMYPTLKDYMEAKRWFDKLLRQPHRRHRHEPPIGDIVESYVFKRGDVWIGGL